MRRQLSASEIGLLKEVVKRRADAALLSALERGELRDDEARALCDVATEELARSGFDRDYEPTPDGRKLEDVIDALSEA